MRSIPFVVFTVIACSPGVGRPPVPVEVTDVSEPAGPQVEPAEPTELPVTPEMPSVPPDAPDQALPEDPSSIAQHDEVAVLRPSGRWPSQVRLDLRALTAGPTVRFDTSDAAPTFRYFIDGQLVQDSTSAEPDPAADRRWIVHLDRRMLSSAVDSARRNAFHRIEISGASKTLVHDFGVEVVTTPVVLSNCRVASDLSAVSIWTRNFHQFFDGGDKEVVHADLGYDGPGVLEVDISADVAITVTALREHKFNVALFSDHQPQGSGFGSLPPCPFQYGPSSIQQSGVSEIIDAATGEMTCKLDGYYLQDVAIPGQSDVTTSPALIANDGEAITFFANAPEVRFGGRPYAWTTEPNVPEFYFGGGNTEHYYLPESWLLHKTGVDRYWPSNTSPIQDRPFVTRVYASLATVSLTNVSVSAELEDHDNVDVEVIVRDECLRVDHFIEG